MKGRAIFFSVVTLCVGACSMFLFYLPNYGNEKPVASSAAASFKETECLPKHSIISTEERSDNSNCDHPKSVFEKEETDDENETSDIHNQPVSLSGRYNDNKFVDSLRQSGKVTHVLLFILLHSWKHFLI